MFKVYSNFIPQEEFKQVINSSLNLKNKPITVYNDYTTVTKEQLKFNHYIQ